MINNFYSCDPYRFLRRIEMSNQCSSSTIHQFSSHPAPLDLSSRSHSSIKHHGCSNTIRKPPVKLQSQEDPSKKRYRQSTHRVKFDKYKSSPISGTVIINRGPTDIWSAQKTDIDPMYNVVQVTDEAKLKLAKIVNHLGEYRCQLCGNIFKDAFLLAQHRCSCILNIPYKCWQCEKVFSCPANLASHGRWHKPAPAPASFDHKNVNEIRNKVLSRNSGYLNDFIRQSCRICRLFSTSQGELVERLKSRSRDGK